MLYSTQIKSLIKSKMHCNPSENHALSWHWGLTYLMLVKSGKPGYAQFTSHSSAITEEKDPTPEKAQLSLQLPNLTFEVNTNKIRDTKHWTDITLKFETTNFKGKNKR